MNCYYPLNFPCDTEVLRSRLKEVEWTPLVKVRKHGDPHGTPDGWYRSDIPNYPEYKSIMKRVRDIWGIADGEIIKQSPGVEIPFHIGNKNVSFNLLIYGKSPIIYEEIGKVHYHCILHNHSKRHTIPSSDVDRYLLRVRLYPLTFEDAVKRYINRTGD